MTDANAAASDFSWLGQHSCEVGPSETRTSVPSSFMPGAGITKPDSTREALLSALSTLGADGADAGCDLQKQVADLRAHAQVSQDAAVHLSSLLATKVPMLRREASRLAAELNGLSAEAGRQAAAAERCAEALLERTSGLRSQLIEAHMRGTHEADAVARRKMILEEEVRVLERRLEVDDARAATSTADASLDAAFAERRKVMEERIANSEARQASVVQMAEEAVHRYEARLATLQEAKLGVEANACNPEPAKRRYEALVDAQLALANEAALSGARGNSQYLGQALASASAAVRALQNGPHGPPEYLFATVKWLNDLAEAEKLRSGLLAQQWREMQGEARHVGSSQIPHLSGVRGEPVTAPLVDQRFSPRLAYDWDLDLCRMQQN
mmetsp:Transcript_52637/g.125750  ORF Transcript_52637/g.125750 Transcript_52637/m.125750 type:complete len:385 (-) Transcript_52637:92-1246(-)